MDGDCGAVCKGPAKCHRRRRALSALLPHTKMFQEKIKVQLLCGLSTLQCPHPQCHTRSDTNQVPTLADRRRTQAHTTYKNRYMPFCIRQEVSAQLLPWMHRGGSSRPCGSSITHPVVRRLQVPRLNGGFAEPQYSSQDDNNKNMYFTLLVKNHPLWVLPDNPNSQSTCGDPHNLRIPPIFLAELGDPLGLLSTLRRGNRRPWGKGSMKPEPNTVQYPKILPVGKSQKKNA